MEKYNNLQFIQCACRFTENCAICDNGGGGSQRANTKHLIHELLDYNPMVEKNIFKSAQNVNLDKIIAYKKEKKSIATLILMMRIRLVKNKF